MNLTPREKDKLLISMAAMVARRRRGRNGKLIFADTARLNGKIDHILEQKAAAGGHSCIATILHVAPDAGGRLDAARSSLEGLDAGVSAFEGMLVARMIAPDSFALRRAILNVLSAIGAPPPRAFSL